MRIPLILSVPVLQAALALGQNPPAMAAQQANQQAMQAAQTANQQAMQAAQTANQQAMQAAESANQQASQNAQQAARNAQATTVLQEGLANVPRPTFSVKPGAFAAPLTVKIKAPRETTVYYTTDGWTPTKDSTRYTGPITVDSTTTIQAIAVYNGLWHSIPASATYTVRQNKGLVLDKVSVLARQEPPALTSGTFTPSHSGQVSANRVLAQGTPVRLLFASDVSSKTADVGDKIPLTLADDIMIGDRVLVRKGVPAVATITEADGKHILGVPGEIKFEAEFLTVDGVQVKLRGGAAKEASYRTGAAFSAMFVPLAGPFLVHGHEAEIKQGAAFVASVSEDTPLPPKN